MSAASRVSTSSIAPRSRSRSPGMVTGVDAAARPARAGTRGAAGRPSGRRTRGTRGSGPSRSSARGGSGWTSMMIASAPTAAAASAIGRTSERWPVPCDGSTMIGRWVSSRSTGTAVRSSVLRVDGSKRADAALAEDHVGVARAEDVLGGHEPLLDRGPEAALEQHRLAGLAGRLEQHEVVHVAAADLEHVDVAVEDLDVGRIGDLRSRPAGRSPRAPRRAA